jgi:hypothetical protein
VQPEHVNRKVRELREAGWFTVEKRVGFYGWLHNVYQLLEPWMPAAQAFIRGVVARARRRRQRPITLTRCKADVEARKTAPSRRLPAKECDR